MFSNKLFDTLKWICMVLLPAVGTLIFTIFKIWGIPYGQEILGTIEAVTLCLGALLGISNVQYYKNIK